MVKVERLLNRVSRLSPLIALSVLVVGCAASEGTPPTSVAAPANEATQQLLKKQEEARERLDRSTLSVDMKVFGSGVGKESKYSREYQKNLGAIQSLMAALKDHPMNAEAELDGRQVGKKEYVRQLAANAESEMALLDQEDTILGYMAKLVALDAMALAENLDEDLAAGPDAEDEAVGVSSAIGFFINR